MRPLPKNWLEPFEPLPQVKAWSIFTDAKDRHTWKREREAESMELGSLFGPDADKLFEHEPAPDELRDAWINDYDADGSGQ